MNTVCFTFKTSIYESNKIFLLLKNILAFIFEIFTALFSLREGKKVNPYFRENESSEASGGGARSSKKGFLKGTYTQVGHQKSVRC